MEPGFLEREIRYILEQVQEARTVMESDYELGQEALGIAYNSCVEAERSLESLENDIRYEILTTPLVGASKPGNAQATLEEG